jgi:hypothetical protein
MNVFVGIVGGLAAGFVAGVVFSGRVQTAIKSLEQTIEGKLTAIEAAIKAKI